MYEKLRGQEGGEPTRPNEQVSGGGARDGRGSLRQSWPNEQQRAREFRPQAELASIGSRETSAANESSQLDSFTSLIESADSKIRRLHNQDEYQDESQNERTCLDLQIGDPCCSYSSIPVFQPPSTITSNYQLKVELSPSSGPTERSTLAVPTGAVVTSLVDTAQAASSLPVARKLPQIGYRAVWQLKSPAFSTIALENDDVSSFNVNNYSGGYQQVCVPDEMVASGSSDIGQASALPSDQLGDIKIRVPQKAMNSDEGKLYKLFPSEEQTRLAACGGMPSRLLLEKTQAAVRGQEDRGPAGNNWQATSGMTGCAVGDGDPSQGSNEARGGRLNELWALCKSSIQKFASGSSTENSSSSEDEGEEMQPIRAAAATALPTALPAAARAMLVNDNENGSQQRQTTTTTGYGRRGRSPLVTDCTTDGRMWTRGASSGPRRAEGRQQQTGVGGVQLASAGPIHSAVATSRMKDFIQLQKGGGRQANIVGRIAGARDMTNRQDAAGLKMSEQLKKAGWWLGQGDKDDSGSGSGGRQKRAAGPSGGGGGGPSAASSSSWWASGDNTVAGQSNSKLQNYDIYSRALDGQAATEFGRQIIERGGLNRDAAVSAATHLSFAPRSIVTAGGQDAPSASFAYSSGSQVDRAGRDSIELERDEATPTNDLVRTLLQRDRAAFAPKYVSEKGAQQLGEGSAGNRNTASDNSNNSKQDGRKQVPGPSESGEGSAVGQPKRHSEDATGAGNSSATRGGPSWLNSSSVLDMSLASLMDKCNIGAEWQQLWKRGEATATTSTVTTVSAPQKSPPLCPQPAETSVKAAPVEAAQQPRQHSVNMSPLRLAMKAIETMQAAATEARSSLKTVTSAGASTSSASSSNSASQQDTAVPQYRRHSTYMLPLLLLNSRLDSSSESEEEDYEDNAEGRRRTRGLIKPKGSGNGVNGGASNADKGDNRDDKVNGDKIALARLKYSGGTWKDLPKLRASASSPSSLSTPTNEQNGCGGPCCSERAQQTKLANDNNSALAAPKWQTNLRKVSSQTNGSDSGQHSDNGEHDNDAQDDDLFGLSSLSESYARSSVNLKVGDILNSSGANEAAGRQQQQQQQEQVAPRRRIGSNPLEGVFQSPYPLHHVDLARENANNNNSGNFRQVAPEQQDEQGASSSSGSAGKRQSILKLLLASATGNGFSTAWASHCRQQQQQQQSRKRSLFLSRRLSNYKPVRRTSGPSGAVWNIPGKLLKLQRRKQSAAAATAAERENRGDNSVSSGGTARPASSFLQLKYQALLGQQNRLRWNTNEDLALDGQYDPIIPENGFRMCVLGCSGSGKTSIIKRFLFDSFTWRYQPTIDDSYLLKFPYKDNEINIDVSDTSGAHAFPAMLRLSIANADAFILVYSVDDPQSFDEVEQLRQFILDEREQAYLDAMEYNERNNEGGPNDNNNDSGPGNSSSNNSSTSSSQGSLAPGGGSGGAGGGSSGGGGGGGGSSGGGGGCGGSSRSGPNSNQFHSGSGKDPSSSSKRWSFSSLFNHRGRKLSRKHQQPQPSTSGAGSSRSSMGSVNYSASTSTNNSRRSSASAADEALRWRRMCRPPIVIVANKYDLPLERHLVNTDEAEALAIIDWDNGFVRASAALDWNIDEAFKQVLMQARQPPTLTKALVSKRRKSLPSRMPK